MVCSFHDIPLRKLGPTTSRSQVRQNGSAACTLLPPQGCRRQTDLIAETQISKQTCSTSLLHANHAATFTQKPYVEDFKPRLKKAHGKLHGKLHLIQIESFWRCSAACVRSGDIRPFMMRKNFPFSVLVRLQPRSRNAILSAKRLQRQRCSLNVTMALKSGVGQTEM